MAPTDLSTATATERRCANAPAVFTGRVRDCFSAGAAAYEQGARLQAAMACRLGRLSRGLAGSIPSGPWADLGSGSGLLSRALEAELAGAPLLRIDQCAELLAQETLRMDDPQQRQNLQRQQLLWDLNQGLPAQVGGAALLASSFTLQWLEHPAQQLAHWCHRLAPGGWLVLAVPTDASFSVWRQAAATASVPYSGLELPSADALTEEAKRHLTLRRLERLRFSRPNRGALPFLREIRGIGAQASRQRRLRPTELRRLIQHWPGSAQPLTWEVLLLIGRKPGAGP
jgi:malonyl-CoA O-methyltransferase